MVALQIRDVPEDVRDVLAARARENGQSLQSYLLSLVMREASFARNLDLLKEIESWPSEAEADGPSVEDILAELDAVRAERDLALGIPSEPTSDDPAARHDGDGAE